VTIDYRPFVIVALTIVLGTGPVNQVLGQSDRSPANIAAKTLRPVSSFAGVVDTRARSAALFQEAGRVLRHPRCANCHTGDGQPLQGEKQRPHRPLVVRGRDNLGAPGMACTTCHGRSNFDPARVPGRPNWQLAPPVTGTKDKTLGAICQQIKDPRRNGGKDIAAILKHMATDGLVKWAWDPGGGRTPAPGTHAGFVALLKAWAAGGAHCPTP